jgi:hypothetical protein
MELLRERFGANGSTAFVRFFGHAIEQRGSNPSQRPFQAYPSEDFSAIPSALYPGGQTECNEVKEAQSIARAPARSAAWRFLSAASRNLRPSSSASSKASGRTSNRRRPSPARRRIFAPVAEARVEIR